MENRQVDQDPCEINVIYIDVTYDAGDGTLHIADDAIQLTAPESSTEPAPSVVWRFENIDAFVQSGYVPKLLFKGSATGPFDCFCQTSHQLIGSGNSGVASTFEYQACLQPPKGSDQITSNLASITNHVTLVGTDTAPFVEVRVEQEDDGELFRLDVSPLAITRVAGQPVVWKVINEDIPTILGDWYPRIVFDDIHEEKNRHFGPFDGWQGNQFSILGIGSSGMPNRRYSYRFELVSLTNEGFKIRSSPDPTVDDEGEPPGATTAPLGTPG